VGATGAQRPEEAAAVVSAVNEWAPGVPVLTAVYALAECWEANRMRPVSLDQLRGSRVLAFAGIATPRAFEETLGAAGVAVRQFLEFADHHWYTPAEIATLDARAGARRRSRHVSALVERAALRRRHRTGLRGHDRGALADLVRGGGVGALLGSAPADRLRLGWAALAPHRAGSLARAPSPPGGRI